MARQPRKPLLFVGSSWKDMKRLPGPVQDTFGTLLLDVQYGDTPAGARLLSGFAGARVMEIREDLDGDTYRAIYTANFRSAVYVLHVFQKKSKRGIATPRRDIELVRSRYALARAHHAAAKHQDPHG